MKHVQAYLSARDDWESCFHRCGRRVSLVQACLYGGSPMKAVLTSEEIL